MAISLPQIQQVFRRGPVVEDLVAKAVPTLERANARLDELVRIAAPAEPPATGIAWNDVAQVRAEVRGLIGAAERVIGKVERQLPKAPGAPASAAVESAQTAIGELRIARTFLDEALDVHVGPFGGVHAELQPRNAVATGNHVARAIREAEAALRAHVNDAV